MGPSHEKRERPIKRRTISVSSYNLQRVVFGEGQDSVAEGRLACDSIVGRAPFAARVHNRVRGVLYRPDSAYYGCNMKQYPVYCSGRHQVASVSEFCVHTSIRMPNSVTRHTYMQFFLGAYVFEKLCCTSK